VTQRGLEFTMAARRWLHDALAFTTLLLFARAYWIEIRAMDENAKLMERYLSD